MKNTELLNNIDGHQYCSIDATGNATNSFPQESLLLNERSIKAELAIRGIEAAKIQLEMILPKNYDWFYLKKHNVIPFCGHYRGDGSFNLIELTAEVDQHGEAVKNERDNKIWIETAHLGDGLNYIENHPADWFIIPAVMNDGIEAHCCQGSRVVIFECDGTTIDAQWQALNDFYQATGVKPALVVHSGKKSLHVYFWLTEQASPEAYKQLKRKAIVAFTSDTTIQNLNREMRFAGSLRPSTSNYQEIQYHCPEARVTAEDLEKALDTFGGMTKGLSDQRWSKYVKARNVAASPEDLLKLIQTPEDLLTPTQATTEEATEGTQRKSPRKYSSNNSLPGTSEELSLYEFLGKDQKGYVDNGLVQGSGGREPKLLGLVGRLTTIARDLDVLGISHRDDAEEICLRYAANCSPCLPESDVYRHLGKASAQDKTPGDDFYISRAKWLLRDNAEQVALLDAKFASEEKSEKTLDLPLDLPSIPVWEFLRPAHRDFKNFREMSYKGELGLLVQEIVNTCQALKIETCVTEDVFASYRAECWEEFLKSFEKVKKKTRRSHLPDTYFLTIARDFYKEHLENKPEDFCPVAVENLKESIEILQKITEEKASAELRKAEVIDIFRNDAKSRWNKYRKFSPTQTIETKFVSDGFDPSEVGQKDIVAIKSGLGTGKTHWMVEASKQWDNGLFVIGYRNMLGVQTAKNLGGYHIHQDSDKFTESLSNKNATLIYCVDSITRFAGQEKLFEGKTVVIDEALSVAKHLLTSSTFSPARRRQCTSILKSCLQKCDRIILLDGHLPDTVVVWFAELAGGSRNVIKVENIRPVEPSKINFLVGALKDADAWGGSHELSSDVRDDENINCTDNSSMEGGVLAHRGKFVVTGDCRNKLTALYNKKVEFNPAFKGLLITSDTAGDEAVVKFLQNPTEELQNQQYDGIFYSPTAESGVDISIRDYFQTQYCFFYGQIGSSDCKQMIFRVRDPKVIRNIWVSPYAIGEEAFAICDVKTMTAKNLAQVKAMCEEISELIKNDEIAMVSEDFDFVSYVAEFGQQLDSSTNKFIGHLEAVSQYERVHCRECLVDMLQESGHKINFLVDFPDKEARKLVKNESERIQIEQSVRIAGAKNIQEAEYDELRVQPALNPTQRARVDKFRLNLMLPNIINSNIWNPHFVFFIMFCDRGLHLSMHLSEKYTLITFQGFNLIATVQKVCYNKNKTMLQIQTKPYWLKPDFNPDDFEKRQKETRELSQLKRRWKVVTGTYPSRKNVLERFPELEYFNPNVLANWQGVFLTSKK